MGLTDLDHAARRLTIGGSDANTIAGGETSKLRQLWRVKTGRESPTDLGDVLPVTMGVWTEELNRYWFERKTGLSVSREGERAIHADYPWLSVTLDGIVSENGVDSIFEAKHVNPFNYSRQKILERYSPQLHHSMFVTGLEYAYLSVFVGTMHWDLVKVEFSPLYHADLFHAERRFWRAVLEDRPPS